MSVDSKKLEAGSMVLQRTVTRDTYVDMDMDTDVDIDMDIE